MSFSAAVIVTTPQTLAFIDVAKGIRMFAKLVVRGTGDVALSDSLFAKLVVRGTG